jgi:photosystem II stability/assembly factor-like uncharacterized protein
MRHWMIATCVVIVAVCLMSLYVPGVNARAASAPEQTPKSVVLPGVWTIVNSPTANHLYGMGFASPDDGWAVGSGGAILHWNGSVWQTANSPTTQRLLGFTIVSATDAWAVGDNGTTVHWDGSAWSVVTSPTSASLFGVSMLSSGDGWAVGSGGAILHWNGSGWSPRPAGPGVCCAS